MGETAERPNGRSPDFVQSLERGLAVIRCFDESSPDLTLSEVARATGLTRAAARRFLHTLVELGYVRSDGRRFALRPRVLELGYAFLSSLSLPQVAGPSMERLVEQAHESCSLSVLDGEEVVYVARVPAKRIMTVVISVGTRFPAYATSMGRVLLAHTDPDWLDEYLTSVTMRRLTRRTLTEPDKLRTLLRRVRSQGYCLVDEELEVGLRSIAVPVHDGSGAVVAALNVSAHTSRGSAEAIRKELLPALQTTAATIEDDLRTH